MAVNLDNVALARRWFEEVWTQRRTATVHELVRADSVSHTDLGDLVGPEPFLAFHAAILQALPDLSVTMEAVVGDEDLVAIRWTAAGTHTGPYQGRPGTGRAVAFRGTTWIRYADGAMAEGWDHWNVTGLMQQLLGNAPG